jgi:hypothetical protein
MKTWLAKLKISNALDDRKPLPPAVARAVAESDELRRFADGSADLDRAFKQSRPEPQTSAALHAAIMHAVRAAEPTAAFDWQKLWPRLIPAAALALLVLLGAFEASRLARQPAAVLSLAGRKSLADASSAVEKSGKLVREFPDAALSPLNDEMLRLNRDLTGVQNFLLASLP